MKESTAKLDVSFTIECPYCKVDLNLLDERRYDDVYSDFIFNDVYDEIRGEIVKCFECEKEFKISNVKY